MSDELIAGQGIIISRGWANDSPTEISLEPYAASLIVALQGGEPGQILMKKGDDDYDWVDPIDLLFFFNEEEIKLRQEQDSVKEIYDQLMAKFREYKMLVKLYRR